MRGTPDCWAFAVIRDERHFVSLFSEILHTSKLPYARCIVARRFVKGALNSRFSNYDTWSVDHQSTSAGFLAEVEVVVGGYGHAVIQNVQTSIFPKWGGHSAKHYDTVHGYAPTGVYVGEEWDPDKIGLSHSYPNPYGHWWATTALDLQAVNASPSGQFVA